MSKLFINFMRSKGVEPTQNDVEYFEFMVRSFFEDQLLLWGEDEDNEED